MALLWLSLGWILYCVVHSALLHPRVERGISNRLGDHARYYRLLYNLVAGILLTLLVVYESRLGPSGTDWFPGMWPVRVALLAAGIVLFVAGTRQYHLPTFLGLQQIRAGRSAVTLSAGNDLIEDGVLRWVRHPWYTGVFCLLAARPLNAASLTSGAVMLGYVVVGAHLEERRLVRTLGEAYRRYQREVPMFLPWTLGGRLLRRPPRRDS